MKKLFTLCLLVFSLSASAQWQLTGARVRYVNGLGIPTRDTVAGVAADSSQIVIRPADSALYVKYKRTWLRVGGTGFTGSGTTNYIPKFTSSTAIGNSQIFDNGTFVGVNKTTLSGIYVFQVNGGIQSTSSGFPFQFHSISNVNYNSFFSNNTTFFGAIGNYTGLISGGVPGDKRDSILTTLSANDMSFATGGAFERVRITSGGQLNVGGQFTQTTNTLNVVGNIEQVDSIAGVQTAIKTVVTSMTLLTANSAIGTETSHDLALITSNTTKANITSSGQFNIGGNYASTNNTLQVTGNAAIGYTAAAPTNGLIVNGNVGVGTTSPGPSYRLTLNGDASINTGGITIRQNGTDVMYIGNIAGNNTTDFEFWNPRNGYTRFGTNNLERMRITSAGRTLINTTTDNGVDMLQVSGSIQAAGSFSNNYAGNIFNTNTTAGTSYGLFIRGGTNSTDAALNVNNAANLVTLFRISGNGNVGIGTSSPSAKLDVVGSAGIRVNEDGAGTKVIQIRSDFAGVDPAINVSTNNALLLQTNNTERMRITSAGRTLINPSADNGVDQLQVNGSIQGTGFNQAYTARTTTYTATTSDYFIDCTSGTFTVNLFTAVGNTGRILIIKNSGTGTITVDPNGAQTIDGAATQTLSTQWSRVHIISDGANWKIISN